MLAAPCEGGHTRAVTHSFRCLTLPVRAAIHEQSLTALDSGRTPLLAKSNSCITRAPHFETIWWVRPSQKFSVDVCAVCNPCSQNKTLKSYFHGHRSLYRALPTMFPLCKEERTPYSHLLIAMEYCHMIS